MKPVALGLACRAVAVTYLACVGCRTSASTGVDGAGTVGGRTKRLVSGVISVACLTAAVACLASVAYGTATGAGTGADRTSTAGGGGGRGHGRSLCGLKGLES
jgi:hypothetical protein